MIGAGFDSFRLVAETAPDYERENAERAAAELRQRQMAERQRELFPMPETTGPRR